MKLEFTPSNVCSSRITFDISQGIVSDVHFFGGCNGNLQGIARLIEGMRAEDVIARLKGIRCGSNFTSCPDQLSSALQQGLALETKK